MYLKKAEYLKSIYPIKDCISAVTTVAIGNGTLVGTPCIVCMSPLTPTSRDSDAHFAKLIFTNEMGRDKKAPPKKLKTTSAKDLYKMDITEANDLIYKSLDKSKALFVFSVSNNYNDFYTCNLQNKSMYFSGVKPIISDEGKRFDIARLTDVHSKSELNDFAEMMYNSLCDHRYINYTFRNVAKSNKKYITEDINTIFNSLEKAYPYNLSSFQSVAENRSLIDVVSISFYRLTDVTAIFDSKRAIGMGVDVFLTNSTHTVKDMSSTGKSITYRFLFSTSSDNIFSIDGEAISRPSARPTPSVRDKMCNTISKNVPNDAVLEEKKPKISRRRTCAE